VPGALRNGRDQIVRIALATSGSSGSVTASGGWDLLEGTGQRRSASYQASQELTVGPFSDCNTPTSCARSVAVTANGVTEHRQPPVVVHPTSTSSFALWNGKRYRGDIAISVTDSGLLVVNRLSMDSYLRGVVPLEIGNRTSAEAAAVQSQAVAARTYAYKHLTDKREFDMYATVQDQVYGGVDAEKALSDSAIASTADVVVLYGGKPINTPYHSTCGGSTAAVSEVWYDQPD
jgi:stage II sporulation protein D